jgi:hypothetical protein
MKSEVSIISALFERIAIRDQLQSLGLAHNLKVIGSNPVRGLNLW